VREDGAIISRVRPEFVRATLDASNIGEIVRPLSAWERLSNITAVRRVFIPKSNGGQRPPASEWARCSFPHRCYIFHGC